MAILLGIQMWFMSEPINQIILTFEDIEYDWEYSMYGHVSEFIADDIPPPLHKEGVITT